MAAFEILAFAEVLANDDGRILVGVFTVFNAHAPEKDHTVIHKQNRQADEQTDGQIAKCAITLRVQLTLSHKEDGV